MATLQDRAEKARLTFEEDLRACVARLFEHFPALSGFSVAERLLPSRTGDTSLREWELYICDIAVAVDAGQEFSGQLHGGISEALSDLCHERPEGAPLLKGRTFARSWH